MQYAMNTRQRNALLFCDITTLPSYCTSHIKMSEQLTALQERYKEYSKDTDTPPLPVEKKPRRKKREYTTTRTSLDTHHDTNTLQAAAASMPTTLPFPESTDASNRDEHIDSFDDLLPESVGSPVCMHTGTLTTQRKTAQTPQRSTTRTRPAEWTFDKHAHLVHLILHGKGLNPYSDLSSQELGTGNKHSKYGIWNKIKDEMVKKFPELGSNEAGAYQRQVQRRIELIICEDEISNFIKTNYPLTTIRQTEADQRIIDLYRPIKEMERTYRERGRRQLARKSGKGANRSGRRAILAARAKCHPYKHSGVSAAEKIHTLEERLHTVETLLQQVIAGSRKEQQPPSTTTFSLQDFFDMDE